MSAAPIPFPRQMKRGPKVKKGPVATVLNLPTAAHQYARFMTCRYNAKDREGAYAEHLERGELLVSAAGWTYADVLRMVATRRACLQRELDELSVMFPVV